MLPPRASATARLLRAEPSPGRHVRSRIVARVRRMPVPARGAQRGPSRQSPQRHRQPGHEHNTAEFRSWYVPEGVETGSKVAPPRSQRANAPRPYGDRSPRPQADSPYAPRGPKGPPRPQGDRSNAPRGPKPYGARAPGPRPHNDSPGNERGPRPPDPVARQAAVRAPAFPNAPEACRLTLTGTAQPGSAAADCARPVAGTRTPCPAHVPP